MADENFTPLTDEEAADAKSAARVLSTVFMACGYPPEVALNTRLTFNRLSAYNQHYLMTLEALDRTFEDCMDRRDPAAYTVYCLARKFPERNMNIEGAPFTLSVVFSGQIREMTAALTGAAVQLAPHLVPRFTNRPWIS
jgi:hypothetical protein